MLPVMTSIQPALGRCWDDVHECARNAVSGPLLHARERYSPVSVLTRTLSPVLTNGGTWTTSPVSSRAGLTCALAVAPLMPGDRVLDRQVHGHRQLDAHRLGSVELHS
jgi:hypothetical protein